MRTLIWGVLKSLTATENNNFWLSLAPRGLNYPTLAMLEQSQGQRNIVGATDSRGKAVKSFWTWDR